MTALLLLLLLMRCCGSGTFRTSLLFSGLRRFVNLVRRGAGRWAELMFVSTGIALVCRRTWKSGNDKVARNPRFVHHGKGGSVAESLACWTQAQKGPGLNRSRDAVA